jgi:hypothetical protein
VSAILVLLMAFSGQPQVKAEPLGAGRHVLGLTTEAHTAFDAAQAALVPTARGLCANRTFFLGAFKFAEQSEAGGAKPVAPSSFQQELFCNNPEQPSERAAGAAPGPTEAQQQAVLKATYGYLAAKDSNRLPDAYAMLSRQLTSIEPDWIARARDFNKQMGAVRARRVTDISWYSNPPKPAEPGLYVAADFSGDFENVEFLCGYVVWKLDADGSFRLVREEQNFLKRRRGAKLASIDRAPLRAQMGCKN